MTSEMKYTFSRPHLPHPFEVTLSKTGQVEIINEQKSATLTLIDNHLSGELSDTDMLLAGLEAIYLGTKCDLIELSNPLQALLASKIATQNIDRNQFGELAGVWTPPQKNSAQVSRYIETGDVKHPERPQLTEGTVLYRRYSPTIQKTITFRVVDRERDLEKFNEWHNKKRVSEFWELEGNLTEHQAYLAKGLKDAHSTPAIASIDDTPVGYFEFYWVKEDRLGPYYESMPFDRGFHFLIGEESYLGFKNTDAILRATVHFIYLDEPRTHLISAEPRSDNKAILKYVETFKCWRFVKEFDFPHKRAALLQCYRDLYFSGGHAWA